MWVNSQFNPSDINSKMITDFTQSKLWLHGPPFFIDSLKLESKVWSTFNKGNFQKKTQSSHIGTLLFIQMKKKNLVPK